MTIHYQYEDQSKAASIDNEKVVGINQQAIATFIKSENKVMYVSLLNTNGVSKIRTKASLKSEQCGFCIIEELICIPNN